MDIQTDKFNKAVFLVKRIDFLGGTELWLQFANDEMNWHALTDRGVQYFDRWLESLGKPIFQETVLQLKSKVSYQPPLYPFKNSVSLSGRVIIPPRLFFVGDKSFCDFFVMTSEDEQKSDVGVVMPWHRVLTSDELAIACNNLLTTNAMINVEGFLQSKWSLLSEDDDDEVYESQVVVNSITVLDGLSVWERR